MRYPKSHSSLFNKKWTLMRHFPFDIYYNKNILIKRSRLIRWVISLWKLSSQLEAIILSASCFDFRTMLAGYNAVFQTLLGTLFTWGLTAAGAALVFVFHSSQVMSMPPYLCYFHFSANTDVVTHHHAPVHPKSELLGKKLSIFFSKKLLKDL